jgi:hypothetical protein
MTRLFAEHDNGLGPFVIDQFCENQWQCMIMKVQDPWSVMKIMTTGRLFAEQDMVWVPGSFVIDQFSENQWWSVYDYEITKSLSNRNKAIKLQCSTTLGDFLNSVCFVVPFVKDWHCKSKKSWLNLQQVFKWKQN